tara:strand:+ start:2145 stop:2810 length:666 start_codon:yes stop_codon:yes gene_type:complete
MCFSENISLGLSILGLSLLSYRIYNGYKWTSICLILFYTIMEITQYLQYKVINKCNNKINIWLTKFSWILLWIQPLMWNIIYLHYTTSNQTVFKFTSILSALVFFVALLRIFNNSNKKSNTHELMINGITCALKGKKHIKWNYNAQTFYGFEPNYFIWFALYFIPIFWLTPQNNAYFSFISQVLIVLLSIYAVGGLNDEWASTWCLMSVPGIVIGELLGRG